MKQLTLFLIMALSGFTAHAQNIENSDENAPKINANYLANFMCHQYVLENALSPSFDFKRCTQGFKDQYNKELKQRSACYIEGFVGPLSPQHIGCDLVEQLENYHGCRAEDYCSTNTLIRIKDDVVSFNSNQITACKEGFEYYIKSDGMEYFELKDNLGTYLSNIEKSSLYTSAFSEGAWQAFKCN